MIRAFIVSNNLFLQAPAPNRLLRKPFTWTFSAAIPVLSCEETEARNLLLYAAHCPGVIASINNAFGVVKVKPASPDISGEGLASPLRRQRLSQHPLMSHRGHPTWPPEWTWLFGTYNRHPDSEAGVLENVRLSTVNNSAILLTMSYGGGCYISQLSFDVQIFVVRYASY
jgi:hypothetical protein